MANPVSQFQLTDLFNMTNFNSKITDTNTYIETLVEEAKQSGVKIATGSYVGTGTYGADNPCSLTFDFEPTFIAVYTVSVLGSSYHCYAIRNCKSAQTLFSDSSVNNATFSFDRNTVSWWNGSHSSFQLNVENTTYVYCALG